MHVQDMNNGIGPLITTTSAFNQKNWNGSRHAEFTIWMRHAVVHLQQLTFLNFTAYDVCRGLDMGGVGAGAPVAAGNANAILAANEQHAARLAKVAGVVIGLIEKGCSLRITLENAQFPFLNNGKLAWDYIVQECTLQLSATEIQTLLGDWVLLTMENAFPVNKYDLDSMRLWIEYVLSFFDGVDPATPGLPSQQAKWDKIVTCVTDKFGTEKTNLMGAARPQRLVFNAGHAATAFAIGPPIVLAQPAVALGDWRVELLKAHMLERWKIAIENKQIHIKTKTASPNVNAVGGNPHRKGRKPFNGKKPFRGGSPGGKNPKRGKPVNKKNAVCFRCGGLFHTADVCPTEKANAPSRKLLVKINYPAGLCDDFKWPDGFADRDRPANVNAIEDDDDEDDGDAEEDDAEEDGEEDCDEDDEDDDDDDDFGNMVHMNIDDVVMHNAPKRFGFQRLFRRTFGARGASSW